MIINNLFYCVLNKIFNNMTNEKDEYRNGK